MLNGDSWGFLGHIQWNSWGILKTEGMLFESIPGSNNIVDSVVPKGGRIREEDASNQGGSKQGLATRWKIITSWGFSTTATHCLIALLALFHLQILILLATVSMVLHIRLYTLKFAYSIWFIIIILLPKIKIPSVACHFKMSTYPSC